MTLIRSRIAVTLAFAVNGMVLSSWSPRIPEVKLALGLSPGELGFALFAAPIGALSAMPLTSMACLRLGSGRTLRSLLPLYCLTAGMIGLSNHLATLALTMLVAGACAGAMDVTMNTQGVAVENAACRSLFTGFHAAWSLGALLGAAIGSTAAVLAVPVWVQLASVALFCLATAWPTSSAYIPDSASGSPSHPKRARANGSLLILGVVAFAAQVCEGATANWSAVYLGEKLGASSAVAGWGYVAFTAMIATTRLVGDRAIDRYGRSNILRIGALLAALAITGSLLAGSTVVAIIGFGIFGIGLSVVIPTTLAAAGGMSSHAGSAVATVATGGYAGWLLGPLIIGGVAELTSVSDALWLLPGLCVVAAIAAPVGIRRA